MLKKHKLLSLICLLVGSLMVVLAQDVALQDQPCEQQNDTCTLDVDHISDPSNLIFGMWNWDPTILGDDTRVHELIEFCLKLGITELSAAINWNQPFEENPNNIANLEKFLTRCHENNIKVELLVGSANWIYHEDVDFRQDQPQGGIGYELGRLMLERFLDYQNKRYKKNPKQCFDGIRLDIEPHGLRPHVTNGELLDEDDPRRVPGSDDTVAIPGFPNEPLYWITWDGDAPNRPDDLTGDPNPRGRFVDTPINDRAEILIRFFDTLVRYKSQLQDDRGPGHITNDKDAVARYLTMSADMVPWYWTVGVLNSEGDALINKAGKPVPDPLTGEVHKGHPMVDHDKEPKTPKIEAFKACLWVPDRIALMGYRDRYFCIEDAVGIVPKGKTLSESNVWSNSIKLWNEGHTKNPIVGQNGPRGALPFLDEIKKPTSIGIEFIDQQQLGFNSSAITFGEDSTDPEGHPRDPYCKLFHVLDKIATDLKESYPSIEGIRYHEYFQPKPGKSADLGDGFPTFLTWAKEEIFDEGNLKDWQDFHKDSGRAPILPPLKDVKKVENPNDLTLTIEGGENAFQPGPSLSGYLKGTISGLPVESDRDKQYFIIVFKRILGDAHYYGSGLGYNKGRVKNEGGEIPPMDNGRVDENGFFHCAPIRLGDITAANFVWWLDLVDANGHFIRRFVLDPIDYCADDDMASPGCVATENIAVDKFHIPNYLKDEVDDPCYGEPLNIDVRDLLPPPHELDFINVQIIGDIQKSDRGRDHGRIKGIIRGWGMLNPRKHHVRVWVEYKHDGHSAQNNSDPNWESEANVWHLLSEFSPINAQGKFTVVIDRPINPTGDSDAEFGETNGTYDIWISVHETATDSLPVIDCPNGIDGIKPSISRYLDMDFSLIDVELVASGLGKGIDVHAHFVSIDHAHGKISGNATGLDPNKTYWAYVWAEFYELDENIWQERARPLSGATIDQSMGGYFEISVTQVLPDNLPLTIDAPRNIWISIHDRPLNLNEFDIIKNWDCDDKLNPIIDQSGLHPLWFGRFFHMDSSFDYYEGFRPPEQSEAPDLSIPDAPSELTVEVIDASTLAIAWNDNSTNEVGFSVERREENGSFAEVYKMHGSEDTRVEFTDKELTPNTVYTYRVRAFNVDDVQSTFSEEQGLTVENFLIARYTFDEGEGCFAMNSQNDSSAELKPSCAENSPFWDPGHIIGALGFDGDDDYIDLGKLDPGNPLQLNTGGTLSGWFKQKEGGDRWQRILDKSTNHSGINGYAVMANPSDRSIWVGVNGSNYGTDPNVYVFDQWTHVSAVLTGSQFRIYVNGKEVPGRFQSGKAQLPPDVSSSMRIGSWNHSTGREFKGLLDDLRIYSRALTASEVDAIVAKSPSIADLIGHYTLDEGVGCTAGNSAGDLSSKEGKLAPACSETDRNAPTWSSAISVLGQALEFDGENDVIELGTIERGHPFQLLNGGTITSWFKQRPGDRWQRIIDKSSNGSGVNGYALIVDPMDRSIWIGVNGNLYKSDRGIYEFDTWTHVAAIMGESNFSIVVNGIEVAGSFVVGQARLPHDAQTGMRIGSWNHSSGREFNGFLDDIRIYDRALSIEEVAEIFGEGAVSTSAITQK